MKTYTPDLDADVLGRLRDYAALFAADFPQAKPARWAGVYLQGLLLDGERKRIEPLSRRVSLSGGLAGKDPEQALQQFVGQSPWDEQRVLKRYRAHLAQTFASPDGAFVIDDTSFPKRGRHSVGVQRQYGGALGKKANCQAAVSVRYVSPRGHYPLTDGVSAPFRQGLAGRGLFYVAGVTDELAVFAEQPAWGRPAPRTGGRPQTNAQLAADSPRPVRLRELAARTPRRRRAWREGAKGKLSGRFAWLRVWPAQGWARGTCADAGPVWLLIEEQADGKLKYALSNLPAGTSCLRAVRLWKSRWPVEQGYQQMKEELGPDHFEGRSWRGFHHHACLALLAYGFLLLERHRATQARARAAAQKGAPRRP